MLTRQIRILVVEDNEDILQLFQAILAGRNYVVMARNEGENIRNVIASFSPDLILLDMLLSDADGVAICRELKSNQQTTGIPVVMVSAYPAAVEIAKAAGAEFFVPKPFAISDLLHTIANAISKFDRDVEK